MNNILENTVQLYRRNEKMTQQVLGKSVGVTRQTIISIEKGNYTPSVLLAIKLAEHFDTPVESLFMIRIDGNDKRNN